MSRIFNMWSLEGSLERTEKTTHYVSLWYIPGGYDYVNAKVVTVFFEDESSATIFTKKWENGQEMATLGLIEDYDRIKEVCTTVYETFSQ